LQKRRIRFSFRSLKESASEDKAWELFLILTLRPKESVNNLAPALLGIEGVKSVNIR
ncbi:MgtC/SapB family protein, partial [Salmonella enterica subsp. diarizonae]|nr:MgtC/SapB family protein [Salmonella enterica subsp. diarizonae]